MGYRVSGNRIYHNGNLIQLYGVNVIGLELNDAFVGGLWTGQTLEEYFGRIVGLGFNVVRLPIGPKVLQNVDVPAGITACDWFDGNKFMKGKKSLELLDTLVDTLEKLSIRYIFDWHYLEDGKIPDLWYTSKYPESQWLKDLETLAKRYAGKPGFVGIDLKNEPNSNSANWGRGDSKDWRLACEKAYKAISKVNSDVLIIVEALGTKGGIDELVSNPPAIPADQLVYSIHMYGPDVWQDFGEGFKDSSFPSNMPAIWDRIFGNAAQRVPVYIGEFGGWYGTGWGKEKDKIWQDAFVKYLVSRGIYDFSYWGWGENSGGDTGGILSDGGYRNIRKDKMALLGLLYTDEALFTRETLTDTGKPDDVVDPPLPGDATFAVGQVVKHLSGSGPQGLVVGYDSRGSLVLNHWSEREGDFVTKSYDPKLFKSIGA